MNTFLFGDKKEYFLPVFHCSQESSIKSAKILFDRSIKQIYIISIGLLGSLIIFTNIKNQKYFIYKSLIFLLGLTFIVVAEVSSELINDSIFKNTLFVLLPAIIIIFTYISVIKLNKRNL